MNSRVQVVVCGWYRPHISKIIKEIGDVVWDFQDRQQALCYIAESLPDMVLVWQSWGLDFVVKCLSCFHQANRPPRVIVLSARPFTSEEKLAFQRARVQGMVTVGGGLWSNLAECVQEVSVNGEYFLVNS